MFGCCKLFQGYVAKALACVEAIDRFGKGRFLWTPTHDRAFAEMKALIAADAFCIYTDHNKSFEMYTDSSDY